MRTLYRQITVASLLASYLFATAGAWLHREQACRTLGEATGTATCGHHGAQCCEGADGAGAADQMGWCGGGAYPAHDHEGDQCLVCRFLAIQKSVVFSPQLAAVPEPLPEPVTVVLPAWRVAELLAAHHCRAPPHLV